MSAAQIICKVLPGLFADEYYVMVNGSSAYYVSRENVKVTGTPAPGQPADGIVNGYIVETAGAKTLVQVPGEAVVGGMRTWVESEAVTAA